MKRFICIILLIITSAGCSLQEKPNEKQVPVVGEIIINEKRYEMMVGKYRWNGDETKIRKVDAASPVEIAKEFDNIKLEKSKKIDITIPNTPDITVYQWSQEGDITEIPITKNQITVPSINGHYIYEVVGKWDDGEASYIFDIDVK